MRRGETILKLQYESSWSHEPKLTYRIIRTEDDRYFGQYTKGRAQYDTQSEKVRVETELDPESVTALLASMAKIRIPAFPAFPDVCDGLYFELEVGGFCGKSAFRWVSALIPSSPWMPLERLAEMIVSLIPAEPPPVVLCPNCGSAKTIPIIYGMPMHTTFDDAKRGELVIGGCCQEIGAPDRKCKSCKHKWCSTPEESVT